MLLFVRSLLPDAPVILEAGGHFGEDTINMKRVWPNAQMHVFEPLPSSFEKMLKETAHLTKVTCYPYALTSYTGKTCFYIDIPNNGASSIGYPVSWNQSEFDKNPIEVPCITLKEWAETNRVDHIDFMWLDMEGHELYALQCAFPLLDNVSAIYTEISFEPIRQNSCLYMDLKKFLEQHGFCEIWQRAWSKANGDALFVKTYLLHHK